MSYSFARNAADSVDEDVIHELNHLIQEHITSHKLRRTDTLDLRNCVDVDRVREESISMQIHDMGTHDALEVIEEHIYAILELDQVKDCIYELVYEDIVSCITSDDTVQDLNKGYCPFDDLSFDRDFFEWPKPSVDTIHAGVDSSDDSVYCINVGCEELIDDEDWHDPDLTGPYIMKFRRVPVYINERIIGYNIIMICAFYADALGYITADDRAMSSFLAIVKTTIESYMNLPSELWESLESETIK